MRFQTVTDEDLKPGGWRCEACSHDFAVGDEVVGNVLSFSGSTPRDFEPMMTPEQRAEVDDWDEPIPVFGDFRCRSCFDADRPVDHE